jgi:antitoxin (DNA-binding transcriptional repressor) of toxin-antitoxin stability system
LIDQFHSTRQRVFIRKRGKIVAKLVPANDPDRNAEGVSQQILTDEYERTPAWPMNNKGLGI